MIKEQIEDKKLLEKVLKELDINDIFETLVVRYNDKFLDIQELRKFVLWLKDSKKNEIFKNVLDDLINIIKEFKVEKG